MATFDEILRRTAYKRPYMKDYKPMFGTSTGGTGRFGGSNFASSNLGYSNTPSEQGFNTNQKFFSAFTPGIAYDSFEEALAVGKEARDTQDLEDYNLYANSFGIAPSAEGFDSYRKEKGAERQQEQVQSQKNAAVARQIFEKERALRISERDKALARQQSMAQQRQLNAYRNASIAQKRDAALKRQATASRSASRTAQSNRMKQLMDNASKGYYSDMSRDQFVNMLDKSGVKNPLDITQAVGGFDAFNKTTEEDQAKVDQSLRDDQIKAVEDIIKNNPRSLYTYSKEPENISQLTMQDKYRLNELMRNQNLEAERVNQDSAYVEREYGRLLGQARADKIEELVGDGKDRDEAILEVDSTDQWINDAAEDSESIGKLLGDKEYGKFIMGDLRNPRFAKSLKEPSKFLFPTKGMVGDRFTGVVDEKTGQVFALEPGDFSDDPNYYYGDQVQGVSEDGMPNSLYNIGQGAADLVSPMTPTPDPSEPPPLPDEMVGSNTGDNQIVSEVSERLAQGQTPEEIMGTPPTISGDEGMFDPSGNFFQRGGTTIEGSNLHQGSKAWTNLGGMAAGIGKLPIAMLAGAAEIPVNAYRTATGSPTGPLFSRDVKSIPMLDPYEYGKFGANKAPVTKEYAMNVLLPAYIKQVQSPEISGDQAKAIATARLSKNYLIIEDLIDSTGETF
tara:strand:+ start:6525 stop:8552 length:2028 start_codon:yes stop_codon:yes gene_type:complete